MRFESQTYHLVFRRILFVLILMIIELLFCELPKIIYVSTLVILPYLSA